MVQDDHRMYKKLIQYNLQVGNSLLTNNSVLLYFEGNQLYDSICNSIEAASQYIHLEYYLIRDDFVWERIFILLKKKISQGVIVRLLYDAVGSYKFKKDRWKEIIGAGIQVGVFAPLNVKYSKLAINHRNHRKIIIVDGQEAFLGGFNIGREYLGKDEKIGGWRDTHLWIEGTAVIMLAQRFVMDWNSATKENLLGENSLYNSLNYRNEGNVGVQIISSGPNMKRHQIRDTYLSMIHLAQKTIYIQSPYFIPDSFIIEALKIALKSGVKVFLMIPCKPDHLFVYWATNAYMGELLEEGAVCYRYQEGFLHAKVIMIDDEVSCCGSANMDIRSYQLNYETNVIIYNRNVAKKIRTQFEKDVEKSVQIQWIEYQNRGKRVRIKELLCKLFSPIL